MRKITLLLMVCLLACSACKKAPLGEDNGCINAYERPLNSLGPEELNKVKALFQSNKISTDALGFYRAQLNDTVVLNGSTDIYQHVSALQYANGLPILNGDIGYHFKNNVFSLTIGNKFNSHINVSSTPALGLPRVRKLYLNELARDTYSQRLPYADSCLNAELGYYNIISGAGAPNFILAWKVTPAGHEYPVAYIDDRSAKVMWYFNGLITLD